jgi:hypothetical protein
LDSNTILVRFVSQQKEVGNKHLSREASEVISCDKATQLISEKMDRPLSLMEKIRLAYHLVNCWQCKLFEKQIRIICNSFRKMINEEMVFERSQEIGIPGLSNKAKARLLLAIQARY